MGTRMPPPGPPLPTARPEWEPVRCVHACVCDYDFFSGHGCSGKQPSSPTPPHPPSQFLLLPSLPLKSQQLQAQVKPFYWGDGANCIVTCKHDIFFYSWMKFSSSAALLMSHFAQLIEFFSSLCEEQFQTAIILHHLQCGRGRTNGV